MPRKRRTHFSHATYHVMLQGNYKQDIFYDKEDYSYALSIFNRVCTQYDCKIHLYCLMTNHIHQVIQVNQIPLSKIMQCITSMYSAYLNRKMGRQGHLFRGRFKDKLIQEDQYLLELCRYIHNNPIAAGMVKNMDDYPWSSHLSYAGLTTVPWLSTDMILNMLAQSVVSANPYRSFMAQSEKSNPIPRFCKLDADGCLTIHNPNKTLRSTYAVDIRFMSLIDIAEVICSVLNVSLEVVKSGVRRRHIVIAKILITYFSHYCADYTFIQIADLINSNPDSLSRTMSNHFMDQKKRVILTREIERLSKYFLSLAVDDVRCKNHRYLS